VRILVGAARCVRRRGYKTGSLLEEGTLAPQCGLYATNDDGRVDRKVLVANHARISVRLC
jgi:hypothetical protein